MEDQVVPTEVVEGAFEGVSFDEAPEITDFNFLADEEPKTEDEPEGESVEKPETEEVKEDSEEPSEEPEEVVPAVEEVQAKLEVAEKKLGMSMKKMKKVSDQLKAAEEHISKLQGEGINAKIAIEVALARKTGNYHKALELLGLDPDFVMMEWIKAAKLTNEQGEAVIATAKGKAIEEEKKKVEAEKARVVRQDATIQGQSVVRKYAEKLPVSSAVEDEAVDLMIAKVQELSSKKDPLLAGLTRWDEAFKKVAPIVEKELYKKYSKAYEAVSKVKSKGKQETKPEASPKVEQKESKKVESKAAQEKKPVSKTVKGGPGGGTGSSVRKPRNELELLKSITADLDFN
jgi:hypothetical protein